MGSFGLAEPSRKLPDRSRQFIEADWTQQFGPIHDLWLSWIAKTEKPAGGNQVLEVRFALTVFEELQDGDIHRAIRRRYNEVLFGGRLLKKPGKETSDAVSLSSSRRSPQESGPGGRQISESICDQDGIAFAQGHRGRLSATIHET
jgi:hypothetical protein